MMGKEETNQLEIRIHQNEPVVYNWKNITNDFKNACQDLNVGELVQVDYFLLFDAMTAIELMDPKMDVGMICMQKKKILNFEQSIEAGEVKTSDFTMEEKIGIIDETFACLATWLEGNSLAQTVFTNLYLHNPGLINDRPMKTFCFSILKIVDFIKQFVCNNASVIDEDVFQSMYGFQENVLANCKVSAMLKDLEEESAKRSKSDGSNMKSAFHARIKFTRAFYQYLLLINKQTSDNILQTVDLDKKIEICQSTIDEWRSTLDLGIRPNLDEFNDQQQSSNDYPTIMGFSPFVNQRTLPPTFPRYAKIKSREESVDFLAGLINRFKRIQGTNQCKTFRQLFLYCNKLSKDDGFHSCVCSRSVLNEMNNFQPAYHIYNGDLNAIFKDDVWNFVKPFYLQNKAFFAFGPPKDYLKYFFHQCQRPLLKLLRNSCFNRARQRDKLENALSDLYLLTTQAEKLDAYFNMQVKKMDIEISFAEISYFNCWSSYYLIRSMIQYLLFGFELELYAEHEFYFIYWYLHENLIGWMVNTLVRAQNYQSQFDNFELLLNSAQKNTKKKNSSRQIKQNNKQNARQDQFHLNEILKYNGLQLLAGGLFRLCILLMNSQVIKQPKIIAENLHILYFRRLSSFISISSPPFGNYKKFFDAMKHENEAYQNDQDYMQKISDQFEEAKNLFEYIQNSTEEIESYLKVVKTNIVVLKLIRSGHIKLENLRLDFSVNKLYPIVKVI